MPRRDPPPQDPPQNALGPFPSKAPEVSLGAADSSRNSDVSNNGPLIINGAGGELTIEPEENVHASCFMPKFNDELDGIIVDAACMVKYPDDGSRYKITDSV